MPGRAAVLSVSLIIGGQSASTPQTQLSYSKNNIENLQVAYVRATAARRHLKERADKQAVVNETLSFPGL